MVDEKKKEYYLKNRETILEKRKLYYHKNKEKLQKKQKDNPDYGRRSQYKCRYGITIEDYNTMFLSQQGVCAICGNKQIDSKKHLDIDHCHTTKTVRGLLCWDCNIGISKFKDQPELLEKAIIYLKGSKHD